MTLVPFLSIALLLSVGFGFYTAGQLVGARHRIVDLREQMAHLLDDMESAHKELSEARDRLLAAWKDGYQVPPAEADEEDVADDPTFSPAQLEWLDQWEDAEARVRWERYLVTRMRNGRSPDGALADAELTIIGGQERLLTPQPTASVVLG